MTAQRRSDATIGQGWRDDRQPHLMRHVLRMYDETFFEVRELAVKRGNSLSEQIRILIEIGLEYETQYEQGGRQ